MFYKLGYFKRVLHEYFISTGVSLCSLYPGKDFSSLFLNPFFRVMSAIINV